MSRIDAYLAALDQGPLRSILEELRALIRETVPAAEEGWAYGMPAHLLHGVPVAGFAAFKTHVGYYPMSGSLLAGHASELAGFRWGKGSLQLTPTTGVPVELIRGLLRERAAEIAGHRGP
jgi:uncharacterized protein YdhG (YjbR/CyaY superfamily)